MKYFLLLLFFGCFDLAWSQSAISDTSFIAIAKKNAVQLYTSTPAVLSQLYNGRAYDEYRPIGEEHPYLHLDWTEGVIRYEGKTFEKVPLIYDLSSDEIVTEHSNGGKVAFIKDRVQFFSIKEHRYEYLHSMELPAGFYDVLYGGKTKLTARRSKSRQEKISNTTLSVEFIERVRYFVLMNGKYTSISGKKSLIKLLSAANIDMRKKLSGERLNFKEKKESSFAQLVRLFDQMNSNQ